MKTIEIWTMRRRANPLHRVPSPCGNAPDDVPKATMWLTPTRVRRRMTVFGSRCLDLELGVLISDLVLASHQSPTRRERVSSTNHEEVQGHLCQHQSPTRREREQVSLHQSHQSPTRREREQVSSHQSPTRRERVSVSRCRCRCLGVSVSDLVLASHQSPTRRERVSSTNHEEVQGQLCHMSL